MTLDDFMAIKPTFIREGQHFHNHFPPMPGEQDIFNYSGLLAISKIKDIMGQRGWLSLPDVKTRPYVIAVVQEILEQFNGQPEGSLDTKDGKKLFQKTLGQALQVYTYNFDSPRETNFQLEVMDVLRSSGFDAVRVYQSGDTYLLVRRSLTDEQALNNFLDVMKDKLNSSGRTGWQSMTQAQLSKSMLDCVVKGDPVDVANYCMMLYAKGFNTL